MSADVDGLIAIPENDSLDPLDKIIQLVGRPCVKRIPYGPHSGENAIWIRVSFSPLKSFPYDKPFSRRDNPEGLRMTVQQIVNIVDNKMPTIVYIVGGDPMFKWDESIKDLFDALLDIDKAVIVETSGVTFPALCQEVLDADTDWFGPVLVVKPQLFDAVPEDEEGGYFQYLPDQLHKWIELGADIIWHFDINMDEDEEIVMEKVIRITTFMNEIFDDDLRGERIVFTPMRFVTTTPALDKWRDLAHVVDKFLPNYQGAFVRVQPTLE